MDDAEIKPPFMDYEDKDDRFRCLDLAIRVHSDGALREAVVKTASDFYTFVKGGDK